MKTLALIALSYLLLDAAIIAFYRTLARNNERL
jgi:hypothetical protein